MQMTLQKFRLTWMLLGSLILAIAAPPYVLATAAESAINEDPQPLVSKRLSDLLVRLRDNSDKIRQDQAVAYEISNELINPYIDFPRITRLVIGKYWRGASEAQRAQLVEEIESLLVRSYVTAMTRYIDDLVSDANVIDFLPSRFKQGDRKASVRANIALGGGQSAEVDYQLYFLNEWKIYDIRIEGISLAITYRTSFGEQIKRNGLDNLITDLAERNQRGDVELPDSVTPE
jgi:phospholipid transport system substrate-binding protein